MGDVHKFKRPPKNEKQFRGYQPPLSQRPGGAKPGRWRLRDWHKSVLAWVVLLLVATGIWAVRAMIGSA
ncbi:MAG: hypothetical protein ABIQ81_09420 [Novosphingobium sp.]